MSLNKEAIQLINDTALIANHKLLDTELPAVILPEGAKLHLLEKYFHNRSRFRGEFCTESIQDFAGYVIKRNEPQAKGFVDQSNMSCAVIFNIGTQDNPGHCDDKALLKLEPTAGLKAVRFVANKNLTQRDLTDWIEDWSANLSAVDESGQAMSVAKVIAAVRNIKIKATSETDHSVGEMKSSRSAMDAIEASSVEKLPAFLIFETVPYDGLSARKISLRLSILTGSATPTLRLRWMAEEAFSEEVAREFKQVLETKIENKAVLYIGSFDPK